MPGSGTWRLRAALLPLALLIAACGRVASQPAAGEVTADPGVDPSAMALPEFHLGTSEMLSAPAFTPWDGGDPTWSLSRTETDRILYAFGIIGGDPRDLVPWMPEACYSIGPDGGEDNKFPAEECLYPVLRYLVGDDAVRFYRERGLMVLGLEGDGPVKVADVWWGPFGTNDHPAAEIMTPQGFMSSTPREWAPYAAAEAEASRSEILQRIIAATKELGPYSFWIVYPWEIHAPVETANGWEIDTKVGINGGCHACGVEFAGRFVLEFSADGTPSGARFDGYCYSDWDEGVGDPVDSVAIEQLRSELPLCDPGHYPLSAIDWENPSQWQD